MDELATAWKRLQLRWEESGRAWDDPVRAELERRYWEPLLAETRATLREVERLMQVLAQARRSVK